MPISFRLIFTLITALLLGTVWFKTFDAFYQSGFLDDPSMKWLMVGAFILLCGGCIAIALNRNGLAYLCLACFMIFFGIVYSFNSLEQYDRDKQERLERLEAIEKEREQKQEETSQPHYIEDFF